MVKQIVSAHMTLEAWFCTFPHCAQMLVRALLGLASHLQCKMLIPDINCDDGNLPFLVRRLWWWEETQHRESWAELSWARSSCWLALWMDGSGEIDKNGHYFTLLLQWLPNQSVLHNEPASIINGSLSTQAQLFVILEIGRSLLRLCRLASYYAAQFSTTATF